MPTIAPTTLGPREMGPVVLGPVEIGAPEADPAVPSLVALTDASVFAAGPEVAQYWAARSGRAGTNYSGAYLLLGSTGYVWWTLDGEGHDPGLDVLELDGLDGHVVALVGGPLNAEDVATPTAAVIDAIDGWACTADAGELEIEGPEAVTTGLAWDDATTGEMVGMRSITGAGSPIEGPIAGVICQHLPNPGLDLPVVAIDVLMGSVVDTSDRWRLALWTAAGSTSPTGEDLLLDAGQIAAGQIVADRWARIPVPPGTNLRANQPMWASLKGELNITAVGGRLSGDALRGDWTSQNLQTGNPLAVTPIDPDASVPYPATFTADTAAGTGFVCGIRLVVAGTVGDASHHSTTDPAVWGTHVEPGALGSSIDLDSRLFMVAPSPPFLGMRLVDAGWAVGVARGTQPRLGALTGGSATEPVDPDGATLLVDGGQLTGSSTTAWENRSLSDTPWPASTATSWAVKCDDDSGGTNIAFAQDPDQLNASPPETPMDWLTAETSPGLYGSEYEEFGADNDPTTTFVSPYVAPVSPARPRNVPGARLRWRIPGITVAS